MGSISPSVALPPPEDTPEAVLRTEVILEARSRIDGEPLTAAEYAQLQEELAQSRYAPQLSEDVRQTIFLLRLRQMLRIFNPF
ncbi:hypothetical protein FRE64_02320 [Euhalothece natronophila Z-M001]|uniref:Uncharacterized protein n=2 Tax=Euhalothece TaxID=65097 RepID=A0A5B8NSX1_9CHRO|nr:hypothetical protein FRE64_02320 [Euhalothece natronophila Z-M001]